jgi:hypothetical protein
MKLFSDIKIYKNRRSFLSLVLNVSIFLLVLYPLLQPQQANATVTRSFVRFNRLATGAAISGTACLKTSTSGTETNVVLVFPGGWTVSQTNTNWTVTTTNLPVDPDDNVTTATAWPGIGTATSVSGLSVVFPGSDLSTGTLYCFNFSGASSTVGGAGNDQTGQLKTQGGSPYVDTVNYATSVVASGGDQITVTASVSATMSFSLSANSIALGTLSTGSVTSGNVTMTVGTNAPDGFLSWVQGTNTTGGSGLRSTVASSTITSPGSFDGSPTDLASNTGVVIDAVPGTNTPTINGEYDGNGTTSGGYFDGGIFHQMAYLSGAQSGTTVTINVRAKIASTQPAASDYTDTLVVVAAGSF